MFSLRLRGIQERKLSPRRCVDDSVKGKSEFFRPESVSNNFWIWLKFNFEDAPPQPPVEWQLRPWFRVRCVQIWQDCQILPSTFTHWPRHEMSLDLENQTEIRFIRGFRSWWIALLKKFLWEGSTHEIPSLTIVLLVESKLNNVQPSGESYVHCGFCWIN